MQTRILVVDDDELIRELVAGGLAEQGCDVLAFADRQAALDALAGGKVEIDIAIIDLVLRDGDGMDLVRYIRKIPGVGVIILSAQDHVADRIVGLEVGADDYVTKPFQMRELTARIHSVLRRIHPISADTGRNPAAPVAEYQFNGWHLDASAFSVRRPDGRVVDLTTGEFKLLEFLITHPHRFWSPQQLAELIDTGRDPASMATITSRIKRLRAHLGENARHPKLIGTLRGEGYKFLAKVEKVSHP